MKIIGRKNQNRRDFTAVYECEHCGHTQEGGAYDDDHFHRNVVPTIKCKAEGCGKMAPEDAIPQGTKYPDGLTI